jgi:hypothetical protein
MKDALVLRARLGALATAVVLTACGGGGSDSPPPPPAPPTETLFVPANAWPSATPASAQSVAPEEFRRRQDAGELRVIAPGGQAAQRAARQSHLGAQRNYLQSQSELSDEARALLAQAGAAAEIDTEPAATLPDGQAITLQGLGTRLEEAATNHRQARDPASALASYALSYGLLGDTLKAQLPDPESLRGGAIESVRQAAQQMSALLSTQPDLDNARLDPDAPVPPLGGSAAGRVRALSPGNGVDNTGVCVPTGYVQRYWFPLRSFVSPVKQQGTRGVCWAFTAISAIESRERVQFNNPANLSEQFFVNKYKLEWAPSDFFDGGLTAEALNAAVDRNQILMPETGWTYNPAPGRPANRDAPGVGATVASYTGVCRDAATNNYTGWCSSSAHQSPQTCTRVLGTDFCAYNTTPFNGPGVAASRVVPVWSQGEPFDLDRYRAMLASGVSLLASFPVHEGFMAAPAGIVSDYRRQFKDAMGNLVDGTYGGHAVQVVGFISNQQLSFPGAAPSTVGGGGYFIVRNSWGCRGGDGGYYYVPADYVSTIFSSLKALDFSAARSGRWNDDQAVPGGTSGLAVDPRGTLNVDLRVPTNLVGQFTVAHPVANYVRLTVSSNLDGLLFDGQWLVNAPPGGSLFANALPVSFQTEGLRTVTITARYGTQLASATKDVLVRNSAPSVRFEAFGVPQQGEGFAVNAIVTDINEASAEAMCAAMSWAVSEPDAIVSGSGCTRVVRFGATGVREVRVATRDSEGRAASAIGNFNVAPPPVNPYPRIASFGAFARNDLRIGNTVVGCRSEPVADNATIDLRQLGCRLAGVNVPDVPRYFAQLGLDNPDGEALTYDWTYAAYFPGAASPSRTLQTRTATPSHDMAGFIFGARDTPYACTLDVRVNAPEPSRSKSLRVWSGRCVHIEDGPR